jgi:hypothetical protein
MQALFPRVAMHEALPDYIRGLHSVASADRALRPVALALLRKIPGRDKVAPQTPDAPLRLYLGALVVAAKATQDSSPKNKHWSRYATKACRSIPGLEEGYSLTEVNLMERQLLFQIGYDVSLAPADLTRFISSDG